MNVKPTFEKQLAGSGTVDQVAIWSARQRLTGSEDLRIFGRSEQAGLPPRHHMTPDPTNQRKSELKKLLAAALMIVASVVPALAEKADSRHVRQAPKPAVTTRIDVQANIRRAKAAILNQLRDPESARWRQARVDLTGLYKGAVCIEVNAKNGYGGYTGFEVMAYYPQSGVVTGDTTVCLAMKWRKTGVIVDAR